MESALREMPCEKFKVPEGITFVKVDLETGLPPTGEHKGDHPRSLCRMEMFPPAEKKGPKKEGTLSGTTTRALLPEARSEGP